MNLKELEMKMKGESPNYNANYKIIQSKLIEKDLKEKNNYQKKSKRKKKKE